MSYPIDALVTFDNTRRDWDKQRTLAELCRDIGISGASRRRFELTGLDHEQAERFALRAGYHPGWVWDGWWDELIEQESIDCASRDCTTRFVPDPRQRFCSPRCRTREKMRRYRATPHGAEAVRAARRRQLQDPAVREYERQREHARYWADPERWRKDARARRAAS